MTAWKHVYVKYYWFQRIDALRLFKDGSVDFLLVTDLASRGLDIERVKTVSSFVIVFSLYQ